MSLSAGSRPGQAQTRRLAMTAPAIREKSSAPRTSGRTVYLRFAPVERGPGPGRSWSGGPCWSDHRVSDPAPLP